MKIRIFRTSKRAKIPRYMSDGASGLDVHAVLDSPIELKPGDYTLIPTGLKIAIPTGYEAQIRPRSGLAAKYGVTVLNTPGTIDSDYRGEIKIILINLGKETFIVQDGMRIAQMVFTKVEKIEFEEITTENDLQNTERNEGGFGHTGI